MPTAKHGPPTALQLNELISAKTSQRPAEYWIAEFNAAGIPCGPVLTIDKVFADPQVQLLEMAVPVKHPTLGDIRLTGQAAKMERTPSRIRSATPERGQHTDDVLRDLGYDAAKIADLRHAGCRLTPATSLLAASRLVLQLRRTCRICGNELQNRERPGRSAIKNPPAAA